MGSDQIGVPESNDTSQGKLSHQQIVHPAERELDVFHGISGEMSIQWSWGTDKSCIHLHVCICVKKKMEIR